MGEDKSDFFSGVVRTEGRRKHEVEREGEVVQEELEWVSGDRYDLNILGSCMKLPKTKYKLNKQKVCLLYCKIIDTIFSTLTFSSNKTIH